MITHYNLTQQPNLKSFYEFAKMNRAEKTLVLNNTAVLLDKDQENEVAVNFYYLNGFFVEEIISKNSGKVLDIIPYKNGHRLQSDAQISGYNKQHRIV